jgi:hypothetical protein
METTVREDRNIQLEKVYLPIVIKTNKDVEFFICQRDWGIEITCNGVTKYIDEVDFRKETNE